MSTAATEAAFARQVRACVPAEILFLHIGGVPCSGGIIALEDGNLLNISGAGRSISSDGGKTWSLPEPVYDAQGRQLEGAIGHLLRLKSGCIGGFYQGDSDSKGQYGMSPYFCRSDDEGRTWSEALRIAGPSTNAVLHGPTVTRSGRIVVPVYVLIGKTVREKGRALFGDQLALVGHHGYEHFFTYCWVYYSDDEGQTWRTNEGEGVWGAGGELFVTLDYSAGGHFRCNEPVVAEVGPDHLLMLLRTPLGRLYQSWSSDDGTTWSMPEPTALASALAPAALQRIPGTDHLLVVWNQSSPDEIERGLQRHRLSTALSKDGGATWDRGRNVFCLKKSDPTYVEPPPIQSYRAMEHAPRLPLNDLEATYPYVSFWKDRVIVRHLCRERAFYICDEEGRTGYDLPANEQGESTGVSVGLPISWFYEGPA